MEELIELHSKSGQLLVPKYRPRREHVSRGKPDDLLTDLKLSPYAGTALTPHRKGQHPPHCLSAITMRNCSRQSA